MFKIIEGMTKEKIVSKSDIENWLKLMADLYFEDNLRD